MTDVECWRIINHTRALSAGNIHRQAYAIVRLLASRPALQIVAFKTWLLTRMQEANRTDIFTAVQWILAAHGVPEVSADGWEYRRAWLVSRGRDGFYAVLSDADVLADLFTTIEGFSEGEAIELAAHRAYEMATGSRDYPDAMYEPSAVERFPPGQSEAKQSPEILVARFPKLAKKFGPPRFL